jgi:hypothetical protein
MLGCAAESNGTSAAPAAELPETAEGTVKAVASELAEGRPEVLWLALPESYRNDLDELTRSFAEKMDPQLYDRTLAVARRAVEVLQAKQELILESETVAMTGAEREQVEQAMGSFLAIAQTFLNSEITTLEGLGSVDWQQFLATTGAELMSHAENITTDDGEDPMDDLRSLQVELLESAGDTATLRLIMEGEEPEDVPMTRVEGRWVPTEMAEDWPQMMSEAREKLAQMTPETMQEAKGQALMGLAMAEGMIEQVAAVETAEEFDAMVGPMIQAVMGSVAGAMPQE